MSDTWMNIDAGEPPLNEIVEVKTADNVKFLASMREGFMTSDEQDCVCWVAHTEDFPVCWHDGVCWESNADENESDPVVAYRRLEATQWT